MKETRMNSDEIKKLINNESDLKELLIAHLGKPDKVDFFYNAIKKTVVDGNIKKTKFSWWGFLGGVFYFLYRKMYLYAALIFMAVIVSEIFDIGTNAIGGAIAVTCGFTATTAYIDKFFKDVFKAGYGTKDIADVKKEVAVLGGYNNWTIYLSVFIIFLSIYAIFYELLQ